MIPWLKAGNAAVITGGANGIGLAAASRYLKEGMQVLIADRDESALATAAESLAEYGDSLVTQSCDVSDVNQLEQLREQALNQFGRIDCVMNNAGASVTRASPWEDLEGWKQQLEVNLWGIIQGCHVFIPTLLESDSPVAVINTGSKQGITNPPGGYAYNLSKAGVLSYTQSLAHALRQIENCPVSVHLLVPGFTYSNMIARFVPEKPPGAWTTDQVVEFMLASLNNGDFYIICPDNDTPRELDEKRMQWHMDELIKNRPALSRWHPEFSEVYESFVKDE